jgi:hypothetical protein
MAFPIEETRQDTIMSQREANLLRLKDTLEHLGDCQKQLQWADDAQAIYLLTETMLRDLDCCRRLCEGLQRRYQLQHVA